MGDMRKTVGIIGFGSMGSSLAEQIKSKYKVWVFDKDKNKTKNLRGINVADNSIDLLNKLETIILAVKPQDFNVVLNGIKNYVKGKLIVSIAAGISTAYIEKTLSNAKIIRAMPNIGIKIGHSVTCLCKGKSASNKDLEVAQELFKYVGEVEDLSEKMMDAATAISGSGPGYYFDAIESNPEEYKNNTNKFSKAFTACLKKAARSIGFSDQKAKFLANWTVVYSALLLKQTKLPPAELKKQVTSKGGTTEAALEVLHRGGTLVDAVKAAVKRARELSRR